MEPFARVRRVVETTGDMAMAKQERRRCQAEEATSVLSVLPTPHIGSKQLMEMKMERNFRYFGCQAQLLFSGPLDHCSIVLFVY